MPLWFVELDIMWWGVCLGGRHYSGHLTVEDSNHRKHPNFLNRIEIERKLSRGEAKRMHERHERLWLNRQTITNQFNSREHLARYATRWCRQHLGNDDWIVIEDNWYNPNQVYAAKGRLESKVVLLNDFYKKYKEIPNHVLEEKKTWNKIYKTWYKLLGVKK